MKCRVCGKCKIRKKIKFFENTKISNFPNYKLSLNLNFPKNSELFKNLQTSQNLNSQNWNFTKNSDFHKNPKNSNFLKLSQNFKLSQKIPQNFKPSSKIPKITHFFSQKYLHRATTKKPWKPKVRDVVVTLTITE
jgi:hypothetical protein